MSKRWGSGGVGRIQKQRDAEAVKRAQVREAEAERQRAAARKIVRDAGKKDSK